MSLASTAFMAAPGLYGTNLDKIDCSDILAAILLKDTSLLGEIPIKGVFKNIEHFWIEDKLNAVYVTGISTASNKLYISTPASTANVIKILRTNAIVYPETGEFRLNFGSAPVTGLNTVAIYGNTTWAATITVGTKWFVAALPKADIDAASSDIAAARTRRKNYTQVFERAVEITQTRKNVDVYAVPDELKHQTMLRTYEMKRELNMAIITGYALYSGGFTPDSELRTMAGLIQIMRDPDLDATVEDTLVTAVSGALTETVINNLAEKIFNEGGLDGSSNPILVLPPYQGRVVSAFGKDLVRREESSRVRGYYINKFITDMGIDLPIVIDRWFPKDKAMILDKSRVSISPLQGDAWHSEKLAKTGRSEKWQMSGQYSLKLENPEEAHGLLIDLTTS